MWIVSIVVVVVVVVVVLRRKLSKVLQLRIVLKFIKIAKRKTHHGEGEFRYKIIGT